LRASWNGKHQTKFWTPNQRNLTKSGNITSKWFLKKLAYSLNNYFFVNRKGKLLEESLGSSISRYSKISPIRSGGMVELADGSVIGGPQDPGSDPGRFRSWHRQKIFSFPVCVIF
jgi:hypothetical protein